MIYLNKCDFKFKYYIAELNVVLFIPVMVMLTTLLCSPLTDSHQYTPLSGG